MDRTTRVAIAVGLGALVVGSAWLRYRFLASSPYPMGVDGYFYPIQLRSVLEHGTLHYPASPLAFYLMAPFAALTDPIAGAKLGGAIGGALIAFPAYAVGARLGGNRMAGIAAALIATTSTGSWYLSVEFVKNGWGLTFALTAVWLILRAIDAPNRTRIAVAIGGVIAAALTHKMALVLVAALGGGALAGELVARRAALARAIVIRIGIAAAAAIVIASVVAILWPERFVAARDFGMFADLFTTDAHPSAPAMYKDGGRFVLPMGYEALAGGVAAFLAIAVLAFGRWHDRPAWWVAVARSRAVVGAAIAAIGLALFIALPWIDVSDPQGLGFRIRIAAFVPFALVAALVAGQIAAIVTARLADRARVAGLAIVAVVAIAFVALRPTERDQGVARVHPVMVSAVRALAGTIPPGDTVVVSERHILFMAAYYTRTPVVLRPEPVPAARRWRLMPLAFIGRRTDSLYRLLMSARATPSIDAPRGLHPRDPNGLVILPEATWAWILERLPPGPKKYFSEWHPF